MNFNFSDKISIIFLLSITVGSRFWICFSLGNALGNESKMIAKSLDDALTYVEKKNENINKNVILGVLIAIANLKWISEASKYNLQSEFWINTLEKLLGRCENIINSNSFNVPLLEKKLWENSARDLKAGILKQSDKHFNLPKFDSCHSIERYMVNGTPEDSDFCIDELINSKCNVSEICWLSELNGDFHSGYKTSHRLLYLQVAERIQCQKLYPQKFAVINEVKNKLCQKMFLETEALYEETHLTLTQDLFMEHIALCGGLEGHEEFAKKIWRNEVRSWQSLDGCFGQEIKPENCSPKMFNKNNTKKPSKKRDFNSDGCHSHVTAVAISVLAFFLRVTLKTAFNL